MNKTMKKVLLISLIVLVMTPLRANAFSWGDFFRALFGISTTTSVETLKGDFNAVYKEIKAEEATVDTKTQETFLVIAKNLSSEKDYAAIKTSLSSANAKTKSNEKTEAINQIYTDFSSYLKKNKLEMVLIMKTMTETEQANLIKNINTLAEQGQKYYDLYDKGETEVSKAGRKTYDDADMNNIMANLNALNVQTENKAKAVNSLANQAKLWGAVAGLKF